MTRSAHDALVRANMPLAAAPMRRAMGERDMVWIPGGSFLRGSDRHYPEERPKRRVSVDGYWIDRMPVTNAEFARFVDATGYRTLAERGPGAGSLVFVPNGPAPLGDGPGPWWAFLRGADWRHPAGPGTSIEGMDLHPVVHLALADVEAYCAWAGTSLPTEEEWEFAAKGGLADAEYGWGDELNPSGRRMANIWWGNFPNHDQRGKGWRRTTPVDAFPANGYGLHDMIGNVWEWTADWWSIHPLGNDDRVSASVKQRASADEHDPQHVARRVIKGGSHLCAPNHCRRFRPAARKPQSIDTSTGHIGMRCVVRPD